MPVGFVTAAMRRRSLATPINIVGEIGFVSQNWQAMASLGKLRPSPPIAKMEWSPLNVLPKDAAVRNEANFIATMRGKNG